MKVYSICGDLRYLVLVHENWVVGGRHTEVMEDREGKYLPESLLRLQFLVDVPEDISRRYWSDASVSDKDILAWARDQLRPPFLQRN